MFEYVNSDDSTVFVPTSICITVRSRKFLSSLTEMRLFGPTQPIVVPKPPFSFKTTSLSRSALALSGQASGIVEYSLS